VGQSDDKNDIHDQFMDQVCSSYDSGSDNNEEELECHEEEAEAFAVSVNPLYDESTGAFDAVNLDFQWCRINPLFEDDDEYKETVDLGDTSVCEEGAYESDIFSSCEDSMDLQTVDNVCSSSLDPDMCNIGCVDQDLFSISVDIGGLIFF